MREMDIEQSAAALEEGTALVDVREPDEFAAGHIPGAVNIPVGELPDRMDEIDRARPVLVTCASGRRAGAATEALTEAGFDATNIVGGTEAWVQAGRPTRK